MCGANDWVRSENWWIDRLREIIIRFLLVLTYYPARRERREERVGKGQEKCAPSTSIVEREEGEMYRVLSPHELA